MTFALTDEQHQLQQVVRKFCEAKSPIAEVRRLMETEDGFDPAVWDQLGSELGLQSLAIPERFGGAGFSFVELCLVFEELGRALFCSPFLSSIALGANAILIGGTDEQRERLLPDIASGNVRATLAFAESTKAWAPHDVAADAIADGASYRLRGTKTLVVDGQTADLIIVSARRPDVGAVSLFTVEASHAPGLRRTLLPTLDQTRKLAELHFDDTPAQLLGSTDDDGAETLRGTLQNAAVCLAAEQLGGAAHCLDASVEYAQMRSQFGRPIGSFQALKHRMADLYVVVSAARAVVDEACTAPGPGNAATARLAATEALNTVAAEAIQLHGGIAITWEHDMHLYFKRAHGSTHLLDSPRQLLSRLESEILSTS